MLFVVGRQARTEFVGGDGACNAAPRLCLRDPNCLALRDCVFEYCKQGDDACTNTCLQNSHQSLPSDNFLTSVQCVADGTTNADLTTLFAPVTK